MEAWTVKTKETNEKGFTKRKKKCIAFGKSIVKHDILIIIIIIIITIIIVKRISRGKAWTVRT
jgi:hypothetical protein